MDDCHLIVGLGNPGEAYVSTRHNAGFQVVEALATQWKAGWRREARFHARCARADYSGVRCVLCEPLTFMNLSGQAVQAVAGYFRVVSSRVMVVVDDADLSLGQLRLRPSGSSGGHHGIESVESALGTRDFPRLRVGIGRRGDNDRQIVGHVLGKFTPVESGVMGDVVKRSVAALECWLVAGINLAMNRFNGTVTVPETKEN